MTLLRKLAMRISEKAVESAKPRCKDWALGLAREMEFIPSDWRALAWAIGSLRVLLRNPPMPLRNPAEIARAGRLFAGNREHVPPMIFLLMLTQVFNNVERLVFRWDRMDDSSGLALRLPLSARLIWPWSDGWNTVWGSGLRIWTTAPGSSFIGGRWCGCGIFLAASASCFPAAIVSMFAGQLLGTEDSTLPYRTVCFTAFCVVMLRLVTWPAETFQQKLDDVDSILQHGGREA